LLFSPDAKIDYTRIAFSSKAKVLHLRDTLPTPKRRINALLTICKAWSNLPTS